ncbi:MAG: hypothetical protein AAFY91_17345, partial [Bacteroidota bacterium]
CEQNLDIVEYYGESINQFDLRMQSINTYQAAVDESIIPANFENTFFQGDQSGQFTLNHLPLSEDPFLVNLSNRVSQFAQLSDFENTERDVFETVREYMSSVYGSPWIFNKNTTPTYQQNEAWIMYREMYLATKSQILQGIQFDHCSEEGHSIHGNEWKCLDQPVCAIFPCETPNSCGNSDYQNYTARAISNFSISGNSILGPDTGTEGDQDAILDYAESSLSANCGSVCASYRPIWRKKLEDCSLIASNEITEILNAFELICNSGCEAGNYFGASSSPTAIDFNGQPVSSFEEVLEVYLDANDGCGNLDCSPYMISSPPPFGETVSGGSLVIPADQVAGFLVRNSDDLEDLLQDALGSCGCVLQVENRESSTNAHQGLSTDFGLQAGFSAQTLASNCQTMELMGGLAQFVSFTVQPADPSVASVFASLGTNLDIVYTIVDGQTLFYTPNAGGSTLTQIEPGRGYEVWVREPTDFTICGTPNDQNFSLPLQLGLNFIGYYGSEVPITNHFSSIINPDP